MSFVSWSLSLFVLAPASDAGLPADLGAYVEAVRDEWGVVGLAVAVVKDDALVFAQGFGEREKGSGLAVDADTLFAIGSNTKAFTAAGLGILVDEKKLGWDDRVIEHLPWFRLYDPWVTREITLRDILSHRSGLGRRGDANWYATDFSREEVVRRIRFLKPNSSFRSEAGYQNTMVLTAGLVTEAITGGSWDDWTRTRLLEPLGMTRSRTSVLELEGMDNVASPHETIDGVTTAVPHRNIDNVAPAGSILSSVRDMSRWMRLLLGNGELEGKRLLSEAAVREMMTPNIIYPLPPEMMKPYPSTHFSTYGLGLGLRDYRGRFVATHTGGIDGMLSQVLLVPEEKLGIVVLTNTSPAGATAFGAITYRVLDAFLGADGETDWRAVARELASAQEERAAEARKKREASRVASTSPSLVLEQYVGDYEDPMYGTLSITLENGALVASRPNTGFVADLEHWHYDTFLAKYRDPVMPDSMMTFRLGTGGAVAAVYVEDIEDFERVSADAEAR